MSFKKYLTLANAAIMEQLQFRLGTAAIVLGNMIYLVIIYYLWRAIYAAADSEVVNGMTFTDTMIYLTLASALFYFMEKYIIWGVGRDIRSGQIIIDMLKPMNYISYTFWKCSGSYVIAFITSFLPTAIIVYIITKGAIHLGINLFFFAVSILFSALLNYFIDFFTGTICIYTQSIWGVNIVKEVIVSVLSGASIPVVFFPDILKSFVYLLPFQAIYNTPLRLLIDLSISDSERLKLLILQMTWVIIMAGVVKLFWKLSLKKIMINGG